MRENADTSQDIWDSPPVDALEHTLPLRPLEIPRSASIFRMCRTTRSSQC